MHRNIPSALSFKTSQEALHSWYARGLKPITAVATIVMQSNSSCRIIITSATILRFRRHHYTAPLFLEVKHPTPPAIEYVPNMFGAIIRNGLCWGVETCLEFGEVSHLGLNLDILKSALRPSPNAGAALAARA